MSAKKKRKPNRKASKPKPVAATPRPASPLPPAETTRASDAKIEQRVQAILQLKLDGAEPWNVRQFVADKERAGEEPWRMGTDNRPLSERTLQRYMAQADERIDEACQTQTKNAIHMHLSRLRGLYARAVKAGDLPTALAVAKELAKSLDLYPDPKKQKVEVTRKDGGPVAHEHTLSLLDVNSDEYKALPTPERLRRLNEEINNRRANFKSEVTS